MRLSNNIQVGILLNSISQPAWICWMLESICKLSHIEIKVILYSGYNDIRLQRGSKSILYSVYRSLENVRYSVGNDAFELKSIQYIIPEVNIIEHPNFGSFVGTDSSCLDIVIKLGRIAAKLHCYQMYSADLWSLAFCGREYEGDRELVLWDMFSGKSCIESYVFSTSRGRISGMVYPPSYSPIDKRAEHQNINQCVWKTAAFIPRTLAGIADVMKT